MVPLVVNSNSICVFDVDHVRYLREHGVVGVLIGCLPKAPQQNVFLGLPLQLSIYEALWLVHKGLAVLVDGLQYSTFLAQENLSFSPFMSLLNSVQYAITLDTHKPRPDADLSPFIIPPASMIQRYCDPVTGQSDLQDFWHKYFAFKYLREMQYFMMPGLRFGGAFVAYPGDPLQFHLHLIVKILRPEESVDLLKIVASGRLATAVKKAWLLISEKDPRVRHENDALEDNPPMQAFSIEWAGFG